MGQDIRIRLAETRADFEAAVSLQRAVWGLLDLEITSAIQLIATTHAGGTLHLAEAADGSPLGFAYAFPALRGEPHLHSDLLAVLPEHRQRGLGGRLKWAQREEARRRGLNLITWTFDPLQARNAHLNLRRLGAVATEFLEDFYGVTSATLHHGLPTDRLLVSWHLDAPRVIELARGGEPSPTVPTPPHPRINEVKWEAGWPVSSEPRTDLQAPALLLEIPPDWDVLCGAGPRVAEDWHGKVRRALRTYFDRGYRASDFAPTEEAGRRRPLYVLTKV
ncbi:MAG TPA: GNAT family N-acetyltransferase [Vicinamibacteria bacterium]|nr:GNAT family N-acetyltransferase [Vicinamibacteria bacterium]